MTRARLLHIDASPRAGRSRSRAVADTFLEAMAERGDAPHVERLDVWTAKLPNLGGGMIEGRYNLIAGEPVPPQLAAAWADVRQHVDYFLSFDAFLITTPMWNFGLPYSLKHFIDVVTQPGMAFSNDREGNVTGRAAGKKAMVIAASAMPIVPGGELEHFDFQLRYLESWLGFIGVTDIHTLRVAPTYGPDKTVSRAMDLANKRARAMAVNF
ncbi:MAG: NAD(P)H-dependent oxidoreductase [Allopontixanthobacter sediminis]